MAMSLQAVHVVPRVGKTASGHTQSVPGLCQGLASVGVGVSLHVLAPSRFPAAASYPCTAHPVWPLTGRLGVSPALGRALRTAAREAEVMHHHSLWMLPNVYPWRAVRGTSCRLVCSPRGTLAPAALRYSRRRKRLAWWLAQGPAVRASDCFHATAEQEYRDIRGQGLRAPVAIIANGVELPPPAPAPERRPGARRRLLFLGRIHPIKGLDHLLRAWRTVAREFPEWELAVVGTGRRAHLAWARDLARELRVERVDFPGPATGAARSETFRRAELYVLPSESENFAMTVAEALAHGVPVITTRGTPWPDLVTHDCGWWIEAGEGPLAECLRHALDLPAGELARRGARGRAWMKRDFSWTRIGERMRDTYLWLLGGGDPPDWVRTD